MGCSESKDDAQSPCVPALDTLDFNPLGPPDLLGDAAMAGSAEFVPNEPTYARRRRSPQQNNDVAKTRSPRPLHRLRSPFRRSADSHARRMPFLQSSVSLSASQGPVSLIDEEPLRRTSFEQSAASARSPASVATTTPGIAPSEPSGTMEPGSSSPPGCDLSMSTTTTFLLPGAAVASESALRTLSPSSPRVGPSVPSSGDGLPSLTPTLPSALAGRRRQMLSPALSIPDTTPNLMGASLSLRHAAFDSVDSFSRTPRKKSDARQVSFLLPEGSSL